MKRLILCLTVAFLLVGTTGCQARFQWKNAPTSVDIPFPDPIDYPEDIPPYEPPTPPGGPSTPK